MLVQCEVCNIQFNKTNSQITKTNHNFCGHSCAAKFTNKNRAKKSICPQCNNKKDYASKLCHTCFTNNRRDKVNLSPISSLYVNTASRAKYTRIRQHARITLELTNKPKCCEICGFNQLIEVCHIIPIYQFNDHELVQVVNSLDNLVYLCPNHHALFDKGLIKLK